MSRWRTWIRRWRGVLVAKLTERRELRGVQVLVFNGRVDIDSDRLFARADEALGLIEQYAPRQFARLRLDLRGIWIGRWATCRAMYLPSSGLCVLDSTFVANADFSPQQIAASIVHEGVHARLHNRGCRSDDTTSERHEALCRKAEVESGGRVPGGEPVVARAAGILEQGGLALPASAWPELEAARRKMLIEDWLLLFPKFLRPLLRAARRG